MENEFSLFGSGTLTTNPPTCALILMVIKECGCRRKNTRLGASASESHSVPDKSGGFNGSTQHSSRTRLALKTKAKSLARVRSAGTLPWLGFDRGQPNRSLLPGKHCRINALDGVASTG